MKIFEIIEYPGSNIVGADADDSPEFIDDEDNRRFSPEIRKKIEDAHLDILIYVEGGDAGDSDEIDKACHILLTYFGNRVRYTGDMYRAFEITVKDLAVPDIRLMSSKLHSWSVEFARQTVSWSTREDMPVTHLITPAMILHQNSSGLDITKLNIKEFANEAEILSPLSNNVSIYGFAADEKFFPVANFKEFVKYARSMDPPEFN